MGKNESANKNPIWYLISIFAQPAPSTAVYTGSLSGESIILNLIEESLASLARSEFNEQTEEYLERKNRGRQNGKRGREDEQPQAETPPLPKPVLKEYTWETGTLLGSAKRMAQNG